MAEAAGEDNLFLSGVTAEQVATSRRWYSPPWHDEHQPEVRATLALVARGPFSPGEPDRTVREYAHRIWRVTPCIPPADCRRH
jgi:glucan phosphorylase